MFESGGDIVEPGKLDQGLIKPASVVLAAEEEFGDVDLGNEGEPHEEQGDADGGASEAGAAPGDGADEKVARGLRLEAEKVETVERFPFLIAEGFLREGAGLDGSENGGGVDARGDDAEENENREEGKGRVEVIGFGELEGLRGREVREGRIDVGEKARDGFEDGYGEGKRCVEEGEAEAGEPLLSDELPDGGELIEGTPVTGGGVAHLGHGDVVHGGDEGGDS